MSEGFTNWLMSTARSMAHTETRRSPLPEGVEQYREGRALAFHIYRRWVWPSEKSFVEIAEALEGGGFVTESSLLPTIRPHRFSICSICHRIRDPELEQHICLPPGN